MSDQADGERRGSGEPARKGLSDAQRRLLIGPRGGEMKVDPKQVLELCESDPDECECVMCHKACGLEDGLEPTPLCHLCAQELARTAIPELARIVLAAQEWKAHFERQPEGTVSFTEARASELAWEVLDTVLGGELPGV